VTAIIAVDVGGTFTDIVVVDGGRLTGRKVPTTEDQSVGVAKAVTSIEASMFLHGTTAATNTLLEERGASVALVTDPGYEDLIEIARQDRPSLYDPAADRPQPLVPRSRRYSDPEMATDGEIVAVALLDSYLDPSSEQAIARRLELPAVLSSVISPEFREYERLATTVLSAYLTPSVAAYLASLDEVLDVGTRLVMTSAGGLMPFSDAVGRAGRLVLSGPAGGAVAAAAVGAHHGYDSVISFDMGGTSTDVCRIVGGVPSVGTGHHVAGRVNRVPSVPIRTIGAGGGSIAWVDDGGALRVGPRSAGAHPGPAVYGLGGSDLTVTDANVLAGNIPVSLRLGGSVSLDIGAGRDAADALARQAGLDVERAIAGVLEVVDAHMERALRSVSVEEGADPRESALVAFGGAGGLHAGRLARRLGMRTVLIPPHSGVFSALGLLMAAPKADTSRTVMLSEGDPVLDIAFAEVATECTKAFREMFTTSPARVETSVDMRYRGQSHELEVVGDGDWHELGARFHALHRERFGFDRRGEQIEVVNVRATSSGPAPLRWTDLPLLDHGSVPEGHEGVWSRDTLPPGFSLKGPATVVEVNSATRVEADDELTVLDDGTLEIRV
jgi:N-methylhydantoinase A